MYDFRFHIEPYQGEKALSTLRCYPFKFHEDYTPLKQELKERGQKYYQLQTQSRSDQMFHYHGDLIWNGERDNIPPEILGPLIIATVVADATSPKKKDDRKDSVRI